MKEIQLTKGQATLVDDEDYEQLAQFKWCAKTSKNCFYAIRNTTRKGVIKRQRVWMHRFIMNAPADLLVDHKDGNGLNNQKENLRICSHSQNMRNRRIGNGSSRFKGVYWNKKTCKWIANISVNCKTVYLGSFESEISAAESYNRAALEYFGDFAKENEI